MTLDSVFEEKRLGFVEDRQPYTYVVLEYQDGEIPHRDFCSCRSTTTYRYWFVDGSINQVPVRGFYSWYLCLYWENRPTDSARHVLKLFTYKQHASSSFSWQHTEIRWLRSFPIMTEASEKEASELSTWRPDQLIARWDPWSSSFKSRPQSW